MMTATDALAGWTVGVTAERRSNQQLRFLETRGAETLHAPALQTLDAPNVDESERVADELIANPPDLLIVQTGQSISWWTDGLDGAQRTRLLKALAQTEVWCRGSKASSACRRLGLTVAWQAPDETMASVVDHVRQSRGLADKRVALHRAGAVSDAVYDTLVESGADVVGISVYRYAPPLDPDAALALIRGVNEGTVGAVTFTASPAIDHFRALAERHGFLASLDSAFSAHAVAVVVGPVCADTARVAGWVNVVEPDTPRLMPMLHAFVEYVANVSPKSPR